MIDLQRFQPTLPARGATRGWCCGCCSPCNFNPRSPHGERPPRSPFTTRWSYFNPRSPHGERRASRQASSGRRCHFNPRSPHGERRNTDKKERLITAISTHAPRTGSDPPLLKSLIRVWSFQPTLPARGATRRTRTFVLPMIHFNPRSPHGERLFNARRRSPDWAYFNPRSPHGERPSPAISPSASSPFQPTLPARGATIVAAVGFLHKVISTHAPRTGSDAPPMTSVSPPSVFQPTLPARGATAITRAAKHNVSISTHAPRTGSDSAK